MVYTLKDIYPIFTMNVDTSNPLTFEGTGFIIADNLFITCWHCVKEPLPKNVVYAALCKNETGEYTGYYFLEVYKNTNGKDLATARVNLKKQNDFKINESLQPMGTDVLTYGFPYTTKRKSGDREVFDLQNRYLEGYITRAIYFNRKGWGKVPSYELDMPCPRGLSGAPLLKRPSTEIIGVIYGTIDVAIIEEFQRIDTETGEKIPELQKVVSFGLSHLGSELYNLTTAHTNNLPLGEFLKMQTENGATSV